MNELPENKDSVDDGKRHKLSFTFQFIELGSLTTTTLIKLIYEAFE